MEETVSVLIWEDAMDMTDWARLLLAGSLEKQTWSGSTPGTKATQCSRLSSAPLCPRIPRACSFRPEKLEFGLGLQGFSVLSHN